MLATDPDREGESISWHLLEVLKPKVPVKRIVFHEITKKAVEQAIAEAHDVDDNLVRAQESRRILDRLYGYTLSPVLWKKVQTGLSAGRVQSVAVRLIVDREEERLAFRAAKYSDLNAQFTADGRTFPGTLTRARRRARRQRQGLRSAGRADRQERAPAVGRRRRRARRGARPQPAVVGDERRSEAGRRASGARRSRRRR